MRNKRQPCVYIFASAARDTLQVGVSSVTTLERRGTSHGERLVHFERFDGLEPALARERQLKRWHRQWTIDLIERANPEWHDLAPVLAAAPPAARKPRRGA